MNNAAQATVCADHLNPLLVICPDCGYEPPWADEMAEVVEEVYGRAVSTNNDYVEGDRMEVRPIESDFYYDKANGVWVYKWADTRLILTAESVKDYLNG